MNQTMNKVKNIVVALFALIMAYRSCGSIAMLWQNQNLVRGFGTTLVTALQVVLYMVVVMLLVIAFQNLLEFYIFWKYGNEEEITDNAKKMIRVAIYIKIFAALSIRMIFSLIFVLLACVALFAPGVKIRDEGVYGAAIFMLVVAGFIAVLNIRVAMARVRELQGEKNDAGDA